jgi:23S rRNA pseudouridine1911/1915/1917 synthase
VGRIHIVREYDSLIILTKPGGMQTTESDLGIQSVESIFKKKGSAYQSMHFNQRIDTPVSGLMTISTNSGSATKFSEMINSYTVDKRYLAICNKVDGIADSGQFLDYLTKDPKHNKARVSTLEDPKSKKSIIDYTIVAKLDNYFVLDVRLVTGRFHQIRCQLAHRGLWIKDDVKYGARRSNKNKTIYLHAYQLGFEWKGEQVNEIAPPNLEDNLWKVAWEESGLGTSS